MRQNFSISIGENRFVYKVEKPTGAEVAFVNGDKKAPDKFKEEDAAKAKTRQAETWIDKAARIVFDKEVGDKEAYRKVAKTEQLLAQIDKSLVKSPNKKDKTALAPYESMLGMTRTAKELQPTDVYKGMVALATRDLQEALGVKVDGEFGGETLAALIKQGESRNAPANVKTAYNNLNIFVPGTDNAKLLAKIDAANKTGVTGASASHLEKAPANDPGLEGLTAQELKAIKEISRDITVRGHDMQSFKYGRGGSEIAVYAAGDSYRFSMNGKDIVLKKTTIDSFKPAVTAAAASHLERSTNFELDRSEEEVHFLQDVCPQISGALKQKVQYEDRDGTTKTADVERTNSGFKINGVPYDESTVNYFAHS